MLPLYIDMHVGGFVMGEPFLDDEFCSHFCNTYNLLVISLNYSKSPSSRFPVALDDIISTVQAVLSDDSLPICKTRVVIGGFGLGGNLALSAAQALELRGKINEGVSWYGLLDYASTLK
jgi:acetyl esterase/lipase